MQGLSCGLKVYNNYMIATSNNNEISVSAENIYYVRKDKFNDEITEYHKIDCPELYQKQIKDGATEFLSFKSKEIKYDKLYNKAKSTELYWYDHKNYACYTCINDGNYYPINCKYTHDERLPEQSEDFSIFSNNITDSLASGNPQPTTEGLKILRKAFYIAIGKERNNLYKPNEIESQGYEIIYDFENTSNPINKNSSLPLKDMYYIQIIFSDPKDSRDSNQTLELELDDSSIGIGEFDYPTLNARTSGINQTRKLFVNRNLNSFSNTLVNKEDFLDEHVLLDKKTLDDTSVTPSREDIIRFVKVVYK